MIFLTPLLLRIHNIFKERGLKPTVLRFEPRLMTSISRFCGGFCFGIHKKVVQQYLKAFEVRPLNHFNLWCTSQQPLRVTTGLPITQLTKLTCKRKTIIDIILHYNILLQIILVWPIRLFLNVKLRQ